MEEEGRLTREELAKCREAFEASDFVKENDLNLQRRSWANDYFHDETNVAWVFWQAAWSAAQAQGVALEAGNDLRPGMVKISKMISDLQSISERFGDTCVYIKPGVSWGAVALHRQVADEAKAIPPEQPQPTGDMEKGGGE